MVLWLVLCKRACCKGCRGGVGCSWWCPGKDGDGPAPAVCVPFPATAPCLSTTACGLDKLSSARCTDFAQSCDYIRNLIPLGFDGFGCKQVQDPGAPGQGHGKQCNSLLTHRGSSFLIYFWTFFIAMFLWCFRAGNTRNINQSLSLTGITLLYINTCFLLKYHTFSCESWLLSEAYCNHFPSFFIDIREILCLMMNWLLTEGIRLFGKSQPAWPLCSDLTI